MEGKTDYRIVERPGSFFVVKDNVILGKVTRNVRIVNDDNSKWTPMVVDGRAFVVFNGNYDTKEEAAEAVAAIAPLLRKPGQVLLTM